MRLVRLKYDVGTTSSSSRRLLVLFLRLLKAKPFSHGFNEIYFLLLLKATLISRNNPIYYI